ncbi:sugar porter family MFS transporter [Nostoc sp. UHCC 0926]|uniref:sugar porter family MFS transporter n=1 Tax=unclassified Nostoc TaxID=2593658 RepID=UPI002362FD7B|nr:sugar porter family MFS transporter [Nostoc sp. UHCC 0926]WDD30977.1 sugar porter family MFS transporter [Nostoc sp. UHCC 0926]
MSSTTVRRKSNTFYVILIAGAAALGGFLFGFDTAVINGAVLSLEKAFNTSSWLTGLAVSLALLGSAVGAFFAGQIADRYGRVKAMVVASVLFTISAIGSGFAIGIWDFIFWRVLGGIGIGVASVIAPAYIAECSPTHLRGRLGSLQQLAIVVGIFIALLTDYFIATLAGSADSLLFGVAAWRWMFWTAVPPAVFYGMVAFTIPESPRYLVAKGREPEAANVLTKILGGDVLPKIEEIRQTVLQERQPKFSDLLSRSGGLLPIVWIGIGLSVFQQFVGINIVFYYSSVLWRAVGFSEKDSLTTSVIAGAVNIITTLIAIAFVDKFGRKPLLILGSIGMTLTLGTMASIFGAAPLDAAGNPTLTGSAGTVALIAFNLYVFCFGFSWGPVVWVLLGEMFNNKIRAAALSVAAAIQWVANFVISTTFPPILQYFGLGSAYGLYTIAAATSFFFILFFIKETKGIELEDM